ncbi:MAG: hypothetical protein WBO29_05860 [Albidovulum sp.]
MKSTTLLIAALLASPAAAFTAQNGLVVAPDRTGGFAVAYRGPSGASDFWCAAGDYAIRDLRLPPTRIIYRTTDAPRRSGAPMRFSLDATKAAEKTGIAQLGFDDAGFSAATAQSFCEFRRKAR